MSARDAERERAKLGLQAAAAERNAVAKTKAQERISTALGNNRRMLAESRQDFARREQAADERRRRVFSSFTAVKHRFQGLIILIPAHVCFGI